MPGLALGRIGLLPQRRGLKPARGCRGGSAIDVCAEFNEQAAQRQFGVLYGGNDITITVTVSDHDPPFEDLDGTFEYQPIGTNIWRYTASSGNFANATIGCGPSGVNLRYTWAVATTGITLPFPVVGLWGSIQQWTQNGVTVRTQVPP